ncbi:MAG TPA: acyl-CoA synthetase, partial [Acidimicrobiales bacterium]|nr:acyl-CoA synthetase [Acidimicrobiales bacterium]
NLARVLETLASTLTERECIVWRDRRLSYLDAAERAARFASFLHAQGLGARRERSGLAGHESGQDHLAIALYNGNQYLECLYGAFGARVAPFNVNYRYVGEELRYLLNDAAPRAVVYHATLAPTLAEVLSDVPSVRILVQVADDSGHDLLPGALDYEEVLAASAPVWPAVELSGDDLYILYTGGTTGMPKGVLWRQNDIFFAAMGGRRVGTGDVVADDAHLAELARAGMGLRVLVLPPLMHGAAQWLCSYFLCDGATLVFPNETRHLDPVDVWSTIGRERINNFSVVGDAMLRPLLDELGRGPYDTSSMLAVGNGGAPLTPAVRQRLHEALPSIVITDTAGASETGAQMHRVADRDGAAGDFVPAAGAVVIADTFDRVLEPGHEGIGWLAQTGWVPLGYLGDEEKTARTFPVIDGVRYSVPGDRARWRADGQIELLGRDSVTINSGGEKIFAEEVESAIARNPAVADVVVTGRPSERWGQEVVAVVALAPGQDASAQDIVDGASAHIARYKLPKEVVFVPAVERSPSGKADYRWARQQAGAG